MLLNIIASAGAGDLADGGVHGEDDSVRKNLLRCATEVAACYR